MQGRIEEKMSIKRKTESKYKIFVITIIIIVMVIGISICLFWILNRNRKDAAMTEDGWVNVELHYIGSAKTDYMKNNWEIMDDKIWLKTDGELIYTCSEEGRDYEFLDDYTDYQRVSKWYEFYDADFDPESALEKGGGSLYVFSPGRKLEWLQYKPDEISRFGGVMNRAGKEWEEEFEEDTAYFYKFEYSGNHHLADVSMEF